TRRERSDLQPWRRVRLPASCNRGSEGVRVSIEDVSHYSSDQIAELVRFLGQVCPESLQAIANSLADNPVGISAFGTSVAILLMRTIRRRLRDPQMVACRKSGERHGIGRLQHSGNKARLFGTFLVPPRKKHLASPLSACSLYRIW
ncbi:hypothetical protein, partial [Piscinibacter sp.]|uniref:hypothetical protein n=1 Tax=Piscinibacter sp. TaxID=1903157 RepID=UPI0037852BB4